MPYQRARELENTVPAVIKKSRDSKLIKYRSWDNMTIVEDTKEIGTVGQWLWSLAVVLAGALSLNNIILDTICAGTSPLFDI